MVDKAKLLLQLKATFLDELDDHVRSLNHVLLELEKSPSPDAFQELMGTAFRTAHSLKGASRVVEIPAIGSTCHQLESVLGCVRDGSLSIEPKLSSLLFKVTDAIDAVGKQLRAEAPIDEASLERCRQRLEAVASGDTSQLEMPAEVPSDNRVAAAGAVASEGSSLEVSVETDIANTSGGDRVNGVAGVDAGTDQPAEAELVPESQPGRNRGLATSVRVADEKLDSLLAQSGELLVARQRIEGRPLDVEQLYDFVAAWRTQWQSVERALRTLVEMDGADPLLRRSARMSARVAQIVELNGRNLKDVERQLDQLRRNLVSDVRSLNHASGALQEDVHRIRMLPFAESCAGLERTVRDLAQRTIKNVALVIEGGDIEVDRSVLEGLSDPLNHLIRNAVDHGIEPLEERRRSGKPDTAQVTVSASLRGNHVNVIVADDGRGLDRERIRAKIRERGLPEPMDEGELLRALFLPGFSTASIITDVSGRGVGLDVVKNQLESLHGSVEVSSASGFGTRFTLTVPLTLTTLSALFVKSGGQTFAIPNSNVQKIVRFRHDQMQSAHGRHVLALGEIPLVVVSLAETLGISDEPPESAETLLGVIVSSGERQTLFVVDAVLNEQEAVIKNLGRRIHRVRHVSGAILLRTGETALLLNCASVIQTAADNRQRAEFSKPADVHQAASPRLLVVDDSLTTRTLIRSILEAAGYDVETAVDGQDAWRRLQTEPFSLVVSDVDMPNMNGFELTRTIRESGQLERLPVILVTARESDEDKARGVQSGADAYLVKSSFDQSNVLETIEQLL